MPTADDYARAKRLLAAHGDVRPQPASDWDGPFPLPPAVADFYDRVGPVDVNVPAYGNDFALPRLAALRDFQIGYRWHGHTGEPIDGWDDAWLVVGGCGGDPFIFDRNTGRILHDEHGRGRWDPGECLADLPALAACLATLGTIVVTAGDDFTDDDAYVRPAHRDRAVTSLADLLGSRSATEAIVTGIAGWG